MKGKIKKIDFIKNMAVFRNFSWDLSVKDKVNTVLELKRINILYGRNYSGKTTLSRIFRALETGFISDKYNSTEFQLSFDDSSNVTQNSLSEHGQVVRVFNKDFVKDNLHFIIDEEKAIRSFSMGKDNINLEKEIEKHETELGNFENKTGLFGKLLDAEGSFENAKTAYNNKFKELEEKLKDKANNEKTGIKHNKIFGNANYNVIKLKADIDVVSKDVYTPLTDEQVGKYQDLLKEESKSKIKESVPFDLKYSTIVSKAKILIEKKIQLSNPINELINNAALAAWVRTGREHHKERDKCAFCGNDLPADLWEKLNQHFNRESEELRIDLDKMLVSIESEKERVPNLLKIKNSDFYSSFHQHLDALTEKLSTYSADYCASLESIKEQLKKRKDDIFTSFSFDEPIFSEQSLNTIRVSYEDLRKNSDDITSNLGTKQSESQKALRLREVFRFIADIKYDDECKNIQHLKENMDKMEGLKKIAKTDVDTKKTTIDKLKAQLKDESKGADRVNDYLNNFFGHNFLSLKAIEETSENMPLGYRFEVMRNDERARDLSDGECSLIAFCYFMAKLDNTETKGNQPIIWIDDPISSLDANHIFFVYSLINTEIVTPEEYQDGGEKKKRERFKQLFISTHNLDFLKYLKRLPKAMQDEKLGEQKKQYRYLTIERLDKASKISLMPAHLRKYVTEFNYLFEQIYRCAFIEIIDENNYTTFYNFGNNARKFLEIYLYYKYPDKGMIEETLQDFFGESKIPAILIDRIINEYSHLVAVFERGAIPVEIPEMKTTANFILEKIKENDPGQYLSLLQSIGELAEAAVTTEEAK